MSLYSTQSESKTRSAFPEFKLEHVVGRLHQLCCSEKSSSLENGWKSRVEGTTSLTASRLNSLNMMFLIPERSVTGCDIINGGGSLKGITGEEVKSSFSLCFGPNFCVMCNDETN